MNGQRLGRLVLVGVLAASMAGCVGYRDRRSENTVLGAGLGGAAGAVLSGGDPLTTIGGAAAGGILGNVLTRDGRGRYYDNDRYYRRDGYRDRYYRDRDDRRYYRRYRD